MGTAPTVVIAHKQVEDAPVEREVLAEAGACLVSVTDLDSAEGRAATREADALMVTVQPVSRDLIAGMERCRIISRAGTGVDAIDIAAATPRGIWVTYVPDYAVDEVSAHALALVLTQARRLPRLIDSTRRGAWDYREAPMPRRLAGQTLGVLGFGRIGRAMAAKARGVGFRVLAHDPYVEPTEMEAAGVDSVDWETLLGSSDFLSLHVPLTPETRRMVDAQALSLMKRSAFLVNTARGEVVDVDALLEAVHADRIAGAALDVLPTEPPGADHALLREERILITPHSAWSSEESARDVAIRAAEEVVRVLQGGRPRCPVNDVDSARAGVAGGR